VLHTSPEGLNESRVAECRNGVCEPTLEVTSWENLAFRPLDGPDWIRLEIPSCFVVFMFPDLRYRPGSDQIRFRDTPPKKQVWKHARILLGKDDNSTHPGVPYWWWTKLCITSALFSGHGVLNFFRPRGPSKHAGNVFNCTVVLFHRNYMWKW